MQMVPTMPADQWSMPDMSDPSNQSAHVMALQRQSAGMRASTKFGFQSRGRAEMQAQGKPCLHCKGTHPDIPGGKCPTVGAANRDSDFAKSAENRKKTCHWMCNRKFRCNGEGHLAKHHRQELEAAGITIQPRQTNSSYRQGQGRALGRFRNNRSTPQSRGFRRRIQAMVNDSLRYVIAADQGDGFDELYDEVIEVNYHDGYGLVPVINTMHSMYDVYEDPANTQEMPTFYTEEELDSLQREAELYETATMPTAGVIAAVPKADHPETMPPQGQLPTAPVAPSAPMPQYNVNTLPLANRPPLPGMRMMTMTIPTIPFLPYSKPTQKGIGVIREQKPSDKKPVKKDVTKERHSGPDERRLVARSSTQRQPPEQERGRQAEPTAARDRRERSPLLPVKREVRSRSPHRRSQVKQERSRSPVQRSAFRRGTSPPRSTTASSSSGLVRGDNPGHRVQVKDEPLDNPGSSRGSSEDIVLPPPGPPPRLRRSTGTITKILPVVTETRAEPEQARGRSPPRPHSRVPTIPKPASTRRSPPPIP